MLTLAKHWPNTELGGGGDRERTLADPKEMGAGGYISSDKREKNETKSKIRGKEKRK